MANADTPNYRPRDLAPLQLGHVQTAASSVGLERTVASHISASAGATGQFPVARNGGHSHRPSGNAVNLEDEMIKVAANQMDYQAATSLYTRSLGLLKIAMGKR